MKLTMYQIDAFTKRVFGGNPAAVCPLEAWLPDPVMLSIAQENNLSETAFFVQQSNGFQLRWFTPKAEVDLCGHATLATADVLFQHMGYAGDTLRFHTRSGVLNVTRSHDLYTMDFPATMPVVCEAPSALRDALGLQQEKVFRAFDYVVLFESEQQIRDLQPNLHKLMQLDLRGVCVTAPGDQCDFVSRFFAPKLGIDEDPVTGSAHCLLTPLWSQRLEQNVLRAIQVSPRSGELICELHDDRVLLRGHAAHYMTAQIDIPDTDDDSRHRR